MAKDNEEIKELSESEDEDLLDFDFDEGFLDEPGEQEEGGLGTDEKVIDLTDVVEEGHAPEAFDEDIEGLEDLLMDEEEEGEEKQKAIPEIKEDIPLSETGSKGWGEELTKPEQTEMEESPVREDIEAETVVMEKMAGTLAEELEQPLDLDEDIDLDEGFEDILVEEGAGELKEGLFQQAMETDEVLTEEEPVLDLDEEIKLEDGLEEVLSENGIAEAQEQAFEIEAEEEVVEEEIEELEEFEPIEEEKAALEEEVPEEIIPAIPPVEGVGETAEETIEEEFPRVTEEKIEAILTKVVSEVLERVAREVIPEVAEKIIREELDALRSSIMPDD